MRNSIWRCSLLIAALSVALFSTGCRSGGWGLPGSSWVSWGKKKPPTSSIAGTRVAPQPPSVTYPPFSSDETSTPSAVASRPSGYPSASRSASTASFPSSEGTAGGYAMQQTANPTSMPGYDTGPYSTGGSSTAPAQQGFYSPSYPSSGPAATTADTRANTYSSGSSTYNPPATGNGYPASSSPSSYSAPSSYNTQPAAGSSYGTGSAVSPGYGDSLPSYPSAPAANSYPSTPSNAYPSTPSTGYPTTSTNSSPAMPESGAYYGAAGVGTEVPATSPADYAAGAYNAPVPSGYGATPSAYNVPSSYGAPATSGYTAVPATGSSYSSSSEYRPGSTGRNGETFGTTPTQTASPAGTSGYPSTYAR